MKELQCMTYTENNKKIRFRLMELLKPLWKELAIALNFSSNEIATLNRGDDPVYKLLSEWLRGASRTAEDPRPTWAALIDALEHANIQEEARILKEQLITGSVASRSMPQTSE